MTEEKQHPTEPLGVFENNHELGKAVASERYDQVIDFLLGFIAATEEQARKDRGCTPPRKKLADALMSTTWTLYDLVRRFEDIAKLCGNNLQSEIAAKPHPQAFSITTYVELCERLLPIAPAPVGGEDAPRGYVPADTEDETRL